jgi:hypothetical protein
MLVDVIRGATLRIQVSELTEDFRQSLVLTHALQAVFGARTGKSARMQWEAICRK